MKYITLIGMLTSGFSGPAVQAQDYKTQVANARFFSDSATRPVTAADARTLHAVTSLKQDDEIYKNSCGEKVIPRIMDLRLDGSLTSVSAVFIGSSRQCFGKAGYRVTLIDNRSGRTIGSAVASGISVLQTQHGGVCDLSFSGPGTSSSVWQWDPASRRYRHVTDVGNR